MTAALSLLPTFALGAVIGFGLANALRWIAEVIDAAGRPLSPGDDL